MSQRPKRVVRKPVETTPRKQTPKPRKPRQRKAKAVKPDEMIGFTKALDYLGDYLLFLFVSAVIVGLAYWFMQAFD